MQIDEDAEGNITLTLLSATLQDKGVYTVKANNSSGEAESFAQVTVEKKEVEKEMVQEVEEEEMEEETEEKSVPPVFTKKFEDATVKENDEVIFECAVNGSPVPEVNFLQYTKHNIQYNIKKLFLKFKKVKKTKF